MKKIIFVGLDVDDKAFHGCGLHDERSQEKMLDFKTKPSIGALMQRLGNFQKDGFEVRVCYEATYLGFSLARDLKSKGIHCDVISPASIPTRASKTVKTDKVDSRELAKFYKNGLLSIVYVPEEKQEQVRDILRSRFFISGQLKGLKRHILATCRRVGLNYKASSPAKNPAYFTHSHMQWMETEINKGLSEELQFNLKMLLSQFRQIGIQLSHYDTEIERMSQAAEYQRKVEALRCYRGIDVLGAMTFIAEIGDVKRFKHPRQLTSYAGMDLREYSSGGRERRYSISKMGNARIRTTAVEACQSANKIPQVSRSLKWRRESCRPEFIDIADRCMKRLHKKSTRLLYAGKPVNKIKVACAREMLGFVWESLRVASAA